MYKKISSHDSKKNNCSLSYDVSRLIDGILNVKSSRANWRETSMSHHHKSSLRGTLLDADAHTHARTLGMSPTPRALFFLFLFSRASLGVNYTRHALIWRMALVFSSLPLLLLPHVPASQNLHEIGLVSLGKLFFSSFSLSLSRGCEKYFITSWWIVFAS